MLWGGLQVIFFSLSARIPTAFSFTLGSTFTQPFLFTNQSKKKIDTGTACYAVEPLNMALVRLFVYKNYIKGMLCSIDLLCDLY